MCACSCPPLYVCVCACVVCVVQEKAAQKAAKDAAEAKHKFAYVDGRQEQVGAGVCVDRQGRGNRSN